MRSASLVTALLTLTVFAGCLGGDDDGRVETPPTATVGGFSSLAVPRGNYSFEETYALTLTTGPFAIGTAEVVYLDSKADGAKIQIGVVRPDVPEGERVPVVTIASPYFDPLQSVDLTQYYPRLVKNFVPHGYAVAFLAVRGTADSGGCSDLFGPLEQSDLDQGITWLGKQDWSNGNVGMIGVSYDGSTPWIVAAKGNPHLKTIVPISGLSDVFQLEYRNGTVEQRMLGAVSVSYWAYGFVFNNPLYGREVGRTADGFVCPEAWQGAAASVASGVTGERDPLGFFAKRNHRPAVEANYDGSVLLIHGLQDWNVDPHHAYPWVSTLEAQGRVVKHWLGQWGHAWPDSDNGEGIKRWDYAQKMLQWFDHWLKEDLGADLGPRAEVQDSDGRWRIEQTWPPTDTTPHRLYLAPGLVLDPDAPAGHEEVIVGADPSLVDGEPLITGGMALCPACAVFVSEPLEEGLRFAGLPRVHVTVVPSAPTGHLSAFLYARQDEEGAARWQRLGWTQMDIRFHAGGEEAQTVVPGEPIVMRMQLEPLDVVVHPGAELVLILSEGTQHDRSPVTPFLPMRIVAGKDSTITLDTFTRDEGVFFEVPKE